MGLARLDSSAATSSCREVSSLTRLAAPARFLDPPPVTRSRALSWTSAGSSMTLYASLTVVTSRTAGAAGLSSDSTLAAWATVLLLTRSSAAASPRVKELCKFAPFPFPGRPGADDAESFWGSAQWPPASVPRAGQWKRPSPAPRAALRMFFPGGSGPARSARPVNPSAQPFFPPPRSTDGAHINPGGPSGGPQAVHQYQTEGDATEATQAGRAWAGGAPGSV